MEGLQQPFAVYQFVDKRVATLVLSDGFCELFGYTDRAEAYNDMDHNMYKDTHPDDVARIANEAFLFATKGGRYEVLYRSRIPESTGYRVIHAMGRHVMTKDGVRLAHVWYTDEGPYNESPETGKTRLNQVLNDALHRESLLKASNYDYLTGLPSMTCFFELAEAGKAVILEKGGIPALLFMDLNGMKYFNRTHGFAEGDKLLKAFASLLVRTFSNENCCHIAGDHFAVFTESGGLEERVKNLLAETEKMNDGKTLPVRIGIYSDSMGDVPVSTACDRAKFACDSIRQNYASGYNYFDQQQKDNLDKRQYILTRFDQALEHQQIQVYYQPIVRGVNGRVCDEEALARWIDPEKGFLSPADFIPFLEEAGEIYKLDLYVLERILEKIRIMEKAGLYIVPQSVNLSRSDFDSCDIVEEIRNRVDATGIDHRLITIEITESMIGSNPEFIKTQVDRFRELGFPVWMDDFGSGYSSLEVLQQIHFDLIKFDMMFMRRLDEGDGRIILTELMRMAAALGLDTVCEGVETEEQVNFLREIGCSKLQGYYFLKPIPLGQILERYEKGSQIGFENPEEADYYAAIGQMSLHDLSMIADEEKDAAAKYDYSIPMGIVQIRDGQAEFARMNRAFRHFLKKYMGFDPKNTAAEQIVLPEIYNAALIATIQGHLKDNSLAFADDRTGTGTEIHSMLKRIGINPLTGKTAVAIAVLSVKEPDEGTTYASIARTLASDYYNLYYVDLETDEYIEYSSPVGGEEMTEERHGVDFFNSALRDAETRIYERDRGMFRTSFTKENILKEMDQEGSYKISYRLIDTGEPVYAGMKVMRMSQDPRHIIIGVSILDSSMKKSKEANALWKDMDTYSRIMALAGDYISIYLIDPATGHYTEFNATNEYESIGLAKSGDDFFAQSLVDAQTLIHPEDQPMFYREFSREKLMYEVRKNGMFSMHYRLMIDGKPRPVSLKIAHVKESDGDKLIAGVRMWHERN